MCYSGGQKKDLSCYNCNKHRHYSMDCQLPKRTRKKQVFLLNVEQIKRIAQVGIDEYNWKTEVKRIPQEWIDETNGNETNGRRRIFQ